jgi:hypothetical protein
MAKDEGALRAPAARKYIAKLLELELNFTVERFGNTYQALHAWFYCSLAPRSLRLSSAYRSITRAFPPLPGPG